jgi:hypothetical protein
MNLAPNRRIVPTKTELLRSLACPICGLFLVAAAIPSALADTDFTYMFTANLGQVTWYNGSTIEIDVSPGPAGGLPPDLFCQVVAMDLHAVLDLPATAGDPPYYGPSSGSLTPFSFGNLPNMYNIPDANAFGWSGSFSGYGGGGLPEDPVSGAYFVNSSSVLWGPDAGGTGQPIITEAATGTWSLVPDAGSSFELLAMGMVALGAGGHLLRRLGVYGKT